MNKNFLKADVHLQDVHITISPLKKKKQKLLFFFKYTLELCTSAVPNYDDVIITSLLK